MALEANYTKALAIGTRGGSVSYSVKHDLELNERVANMESMLDKELGYEKLFPKGLMNVQSQDHLMIKGKIN